MNKKTIDIKIIVIKQTQNESEWILVEDKEYLAEIRKKKIKKLLESDKNNANK